MKTLSYAITACSEHEELDRLLGQLKQHIRPQDEVMIQLDTTATEEVRKVIDKYSIGSFQYFHRIFAPLNNDFASFKNNLKIHCIKDYIFFIDADEYLSEDLIVDLPSILELNDIDLYLVPRVNTVKDLTPEHIIKWGWNVSVEGYVNYPDYQTRIVRNTKTIQWKGKVHERLEGFITHAILPAGYHLLHPKDIIRQEKQNAYYNTL